MSTLFSQLRTYKKQKGVAMLFSILLTSGLLLIALGISNIAYREAVFAVEARDSDRAFFAADNGMECGLYLDGLGTFASGATVTPSCNGTTVAYSMTGGSATTPIEQFIINTGNNTCAQVTVDKTITIAGSPGTEVTSYGFNVPPSGASTTACFTGTPNARTVSRALKADYVSS